MLYYIIILKNKLLYDNYFLKWALLFLGKDFQAIAETLGTKTEAHVRTFFISYRRRYNLDAVLREHEADRGNSNHIPAGNLNGLLKLAINLWNKCASSGIANIDSRVLDKSWRTPQTMQFSFLAVSWSFEVGTIKSTDRMDLRNVISDIVGCGGAPRLLLTLPNG